MLFFGERALNEQYLASNTAPVLFGCCSKARTPCIAITGPVRGLCSLVAASHYIARTPSFASPPISSQSSPLRVVIAVKRHAVSSTSSFMRLSAKHLQDPDGRLASPISNLRRDLPVLAGHTQHGRDGAQRCSHEMLQGTVLGTAITAGVL